MLHSYQGKQHFTVGYLRKYRRYVPMALGTHGKKTVGHVEDIKEQTNVHSISHWNVGSFKGMSKYMTLGTFRVQRLKSRGT